MIHQKSSKIIGWIFNYAFIELKFLIVVAPQFMLSKCDFLFTIIREHRDFRDWVYISDQLDTYVILYCRGDIYQKLLKPLLFLWMKLRKRHHFENKLTNFFPTVLPEVIPRQSNAMHFDSFFVYNNKC